MSGFSRRHILRQGIPIGIAGGLIAVAMWCVVFVAPTERTMGAVQRILYIHVAVAIPGLVGMCLMAVCGACYLISQQQLWDRWSLAVAELGWLAATLTLLTGSLWAHQAWGVWWTWDPRLTAMFVLWVLYTAYLLLRAELKNSPACARIGALVSLVCVADVPLVWLATRWFRGIHPIAPSMTSAMRMTLLVTCIAMAVSFAVLAFCRQDQVALARQVAAGQARPKSPAKISSRR